MDIFETVNAIYTSRNITFIYEIDNNVQPFIIFKFLSQNDKLKNICVELNKYVWILDREQFFALCYALIPRQDKQPFIRFVKEKEELDIYDEVFKRLQHSFQIGNNDIQSSKQLLKTIIDNDKIEWFSKLGISKETWNLHKLDLKLIDKEKPKAKIGLDAFM